MSLIFSETSLAKDTFTIFCLASFVDFFMHIMVDDVKGDVNDDGGWW